ncbi:MAG: RsmD family RNA methyltransferase [Candidatus Nasuia deltocephalinicola]
MTSGKYKNSKILFPKKFYDLKYFKPTLNHIKNIIFNWVGSLKNFFCLDLFSCSGFLGFEAASRGCKLSILLEKNKKFFFYLKKNFLNLGFKNLKLFNCDFFSYLKKNNIGFYDLIFIDSPYINLKNLIKFFKLSFNILKKGSILYVETIFNIDFIIKKLETKFKVLNNFFFSKINFFLFKVI